MYDKKYSAFVFRKKINYFVKPILIISIIFILYQLLMFFQLTKEAKVIHKNYDFVLGIHEGQRDFYVPDAEGGFSCTHSMEKILFKNVNDNYCDCLDGSDEPGTSACPNGNFFCTLQADYKNYLKRLPSNRVNDGICDCCDGSDEWMPKELSFSLRGEIQKKLGRYHSPCPNLCGH